MKGSPSVGFDNNTDLHPASQVPSYVENISYNEMMAVVPYRAFQKHKHTYPEFLLALNGWILA